MFPMTFASVFFALFLARPALAGTPLDLDAHTILELNHDTRKPRNRPEASDRLDSARFPLAVHFLDGVTPLYAASILEYAEKSWEVLFQDLGFLPPLPDHGLGGDDRFDIYISTDMDPRIGGFTSFSGFEDSTPAADAYGFTVINNNLNPKLVRGVVAHELFHGSQMAYDWWEHPSFAEATANWVVQFVFPDEDIYWRYFKYFNLHPEQPLDFVSLMDPFQYGGALFYQFLDEKYGANSGAIGRELWESCVQIDMDNEPDFLDALELVIAKRSGGAISMRDAWGEFGFWRWLIGDWNDGLHFKNAGHWLDSGPALAAEVSLKQQSRGDVPVTLTPWSHSFIKFQDIEEDVSKINVNVATAGSALLDIGVVVRTGEGIHTMDLVKGDEFGNLQTVLAVPNGTKELIVFISAAPRGIYDPESSGAVKYPVRFSWTRGK